MSLNNNLDKILIIDFGSQFTQLIARRIRELGVFSEIVSHKKINSLKMFNNVIGVILSGGPLNVYNSYKFRFNRKVLFLNIPILGICFGHQIISKELGGKVKKSRLNCPCQFRLFISPKKVGSKINIPSLWITGNVYPITLRAIMSRKSLKMFIKHFF